MASTVIDAQVSKCVGLSLGARHWGVCRVTSDGKGAEELIRNSRSHTAPAVLLPNLSGEPVRFDTWHPPHPRGAGGNWPPEAVVQPGSGSGRLPMPFAWTGRRQDEIWEWHHQGESQQLSCLDAIGWGVYHMIRRFAADCSTSVVIPNDFQQREQQRVLDICRQPGADVSLIWLPIAAALSWLRSAGLSPPSNRRKSAGELLVIHADWATVYTTRLELIGWPVESPMYWLPARRRPAVSDFNFHGFGWAEVARCTEQRTCDVWRDLFVSPVSDSFVFDPTAKLSTKRTLLDHLTPWRLESGDVDHCRANVIDGIDQCKSVAGVVVVGDFAELLCAGDEWDDVVSEIERRCGKGSVVVAGGADGEALLAQGAAIHRRLLAENRVSYLDTLPSLELFIDRVHRYEWLSLLGDQDRFVAGGKEWTLGEPVDGLAVPRGAARVKIVVAHEEYKGVRELTASLATAAEQRVPAKLYVSCTPAQGNAHLRLVTEKHGDMPAMSIPASWYHMEVKRDPNGRELGKEEYLKSQPRAFPELMPRRKSWSKWRAAKPIIVQFLEKMDRVQPAAIMKQYVLLDDIKGRLMQKDQSQTPHDATAIGSDFVAPDEQQLLERLARALLILWREYRGHGNSKVSSVIRSLGYISVEDSEFESWLVSHVHNQYWDSQCVRHTCGLVLRNPNGISRFIEQMFTADHRESSLPKANDLKAVSQILRYRADATAELDSKIAARIVDRCLLVFSVGMNKDGKGYPFRWSSLIVVYLLRRRMYDPEFMEPNQPLAMRAKELFTEAIERYKKRRLRPLGGSVDLPAALRQMIDYIDRRGSGDILMANE